VSGPADGSRPIGVFDSGVGGLTVVSALRRRLPGESIVYLGDTARLPYGSKSPETVTQYTRKNVAFLLARGVKAVVVACNTASALALPHLVSPVPTWGVVGPGARRAAAVSRGRVGVIATQSTVRSDAYGRALRELVPGIEVTSHACPLLVPLVEEGWHDDPITEEVARRYLAPLLAAGIDTLVLGCTHYPLLRGLLARVAGDGVELVDSAESTAEEVARGLAEAGLAGPPGAEPRHQLFLTDTSENFGSFARRILGDDRAPLEWVEVV
jgi:glutamate racemase